MAITFDRKYPAELTNAAWQKKKSFLDKAKAKTKTGLGDALTLAQTEWNKITFDHLEASKQELAEGMRPYPLIERNRGRAKSLLAGQVEVTILALEAAASKARKTSQMPGLSTGAATAAKTISGKLLAQARLLHTIRLNDFDAELQKARRDYEVLEAGYKKWIVALERSMDNLERNPTLAPWSTPEMGELIFKAYHFTITSVDSIGLKEFEGQRQSWAKIQELYGQTGARAKRIPPPQRPEFIREFAEQVKTLLGPMY